MSDLLINPYSFAAAPGGGFEPEDVVGAAACWVADDCSAVGDGNAITNWVDRVAAFTLTQGTSGNRPLYRSSGIGGAPAVDFDGSNDLLRYAGTVSTANTGHVFAVAYHDAGTGATQAYWCSGDEATDENFILGSRYETNTTLAVQSTIAGQTDWVRGNTTISLTTAYLLEWASDGSDYAERVNNTVQTRTVLGGADTGDWFGDVSGRDNFVLGALKLNFGGANHANVRLGMVLVVDGAISSDDRSALGDWVSSKYSITLA